ncbi:hypothetical protein NDU88_003237 [Pleurodeles waltl]|uniref:Uncharacterized protein n=1 Tax=Pleurodeles waltl TaxID=8319 RepID=A0AAV7WNJ7_PLEWA|nr:hypothetical protein NDU88_003237 [Pleurodeles waltl]
MKISSAPLSSNLSETGGRGAGDPRQLWPFVPEAGRIAAPLQQLRPPPVSPGPMATGRSLHFARSPPAQCGSPLSGHAMLQALSSAFPGLSAIARDLCYFAMRMPS